MHNLPHTTEEAIELLESKGYTITPPKKPTGRIKVLPEIGTEYWAIDYDGDVISIKYREKSTDLECYILGNMFHDRESAEQAKPEYVAWLESTAEVLSRIAELNPEGWEPDFENNMSNKYRFEYSPEVGVHIVFNTEYQYIYKSHYMATEEIAQQILAEMPEDVERMIRR